MNRQTVQTALGRVVRTTPTNITKTQCLNARNLSTTQTNRSDESEKPSGREKSAQAAAKLGQLVRPPPGFRRLRLGPSAASSSPSSAESSSSAPAVAPRTASGPLDARTLGAKAIPGPGAKVLNLRSLRAPGGATGKFPGPGVSTPSGPGVGRLVNRAGGGSSRLGGGGGIARGGARRPGGPGGGSRFGGGATGTKGRFSKKPIKKKKEDRVGDKPVDREWSTAEMEVLDRLDQGEYIRHTPQADLASLAGYGPAIATDNTLGRVESALRAMRIMGGGRAFDNDPASTVHTREFSKRYLHDKKPIFLNTLEEREWLRTSMGVNKLKGPAETVKQAVIETVIQGKYTAPEFKDLSDVKGLVANYQNRQAAYRLSHCQEFTDKLVSILPQAKAGNAAAAASK